MLKNIFLVLVIYFIASCSSMAQEEGSTHPQENNEVTAPLLKQPENKTEDKISTTASHPQQPQTAADVGIRAGDIYVSCKDYFQNKFNNKENISKRATCNGYFFGVASTLLTLESSRVDTHICLPKDISTHQVIKAFIEWGAANEASLPMVATEGTLKALAEKYPCI